MFGPNKSTRVSTIKLLTDSIQAPTSGILQLDNVPSWLRGISVFQLNAGEALLNAMRDDFEQKTTHRIQNCLRDFGLVPLIKSDQIRFLLKISRGNDLAFLWFLMELHYKTESNDWGPDKVYNINEQIIMTLICHLDMVPTLRELHRILPPGHEALWKINKRNLAKEALAKSKKQKRKVESETSKKQSPYVMRLRSRPHYGKPLFISRPHFQVAFENRNYEDLNYIARNELNRWYGTYEVHPGRRVAYRIINQVITEIILSKTQKGGLSKKIQERFKIQKLRDLIPKDKKILCLYHRWCEELEELKYHRKVLEKQEFCLKCLDFNVAERERAKILLKEFDGEIKRFEMKLRHLKNLESNVFFKVDNDKNDIECFEDLSKTDVDLQKLARTNCCDTITLSKLNTKFDGPIKAGDFAYLITSTDATVKLPHVNDKTTKEIRRYSGCENVRSLGVPCEVINHITNPCSNKEDQLDECPKSSQTFYKTATEHQPYIFDYQKIFKFEDPEMNIKKFIINALRNDKILHEDQINESAVQDAFNKCTFKLIKDAINLKSKEIPRVVLNKTPLEEFQSKYNAKYYDCDNFDFLNDMLKDALNVVSKNPNFVLASLPDAHKVPRLNEWVYQRYGKSYSSEEMLTEWKHSKQLFRVLESLPVHIEGPTNHQIGKNLFANYGMHDYLLAKKKNVGDKFKSVVNTLALELTRIYWFAARPHLCRKGAARETFFAYLPPTPAYIHQFRVWKPQEYMDAKQLWERRVKSGDAIIQ